MANRLLDFVAGSDGNWYFENFGEALVYAVVGFLIVFLGISLIILIIWLLGLLFKKTNNLAFLNGLGGKIKNLFKKNKKKEEPAPQAVPAETEDVPDEIKAAIMAAIMAYYSEEQPKCEFKVKRIKRI